MQRKKVSAKTNKRNLICLSIPTVYGIYGCATLVLEHSNKEMNVKFDITGVIKDALSRQEEEAIRICLRKHYALLSSKTLSIHTYFSHPPSPCM